MFGGGRTMVFCYFLTGFNVLVIMPWNALSKFLVAPKLYFAVWNRETFIPWGQDTALIDISPSLVMWIISIPAVMCPARSNSGNTAIFFYSFLKTKSYAYAFSFKIIMDTKIIMTAISTAMSIQTKAAASFRAVLSIGTVLS